MKPSSSQSPEKSFQNNPLFDSKGSRKYLTDKERKAFLDSARKAPRDIRTFCMVLAYTGCRLSEALELSTKRIDVDERVIIFETLKKGHKGVFRTVPVPTEVLDTLDMVHGIREAQKKGWNAPLWPWSRTTAWRRVKDVMASAGLDTGIHASPKGLRHAFGVGAVKKGIALNMAQRWLGHSQITTTAIYAHAIGEEEHEIAKRMWE